MIKSLTPVETGCAPKPAKTWHCGTLIYSKAGLISLFVFLLWGSFTFSLMMQVVPSILPLKLKSLGASNMLIGLLLTSVFSLFGMFISPYLSFKSDYLRTRWGRRIPFFFFSLPFVTLSILLLAFSEDIAWFLHHSGFLGMISPKTATIGVIAVCVVAFQLSDVVICSVYNYIFNDTVPVMLIGRFIGLMQVVGGVVGFLYNYFIFKYAESHMKEIFIGTAILYFIGIGMMCLFVKEGEYPPVTEKERENIRGFAGFKTFFRESFSHKFYWTKFLYAMAPALTWYALAPFNIFYYKEMGLSLEYAGKAFAVTAVAGIFAAYFSSIFIDRWHPLRILTYSAVFTAALSMGGWVWLFVTLPPAAFFWLSMLGGGLIGIFNTALMSLASMPFDIRLQPKSRYGQFCSAQSILANCCKVVAGLCAGLFFDFLKWVFHGSDYAYRFGFVWTAVANLFLALVICSLYRQWKALGGDLHFHPPAPWSETGYEEMEQTPFVGVQTRWLNYALKMTHLLLLLTIIYLIPLTFWLWHIGWAFDFKFCLLGMIPVSITIYAVWIKVERSIRDDLARCAAGEPIRNGIPHHGVFFVKASAMLLGVAVSIGTLIVAVRTGLQVGVLVFAISSQLNNAMVIVAVLILRRLERGYDPMLNYDGRMVTQTDGQGPVEQARADGFTARLPDDNPEDLAHTCR